MAPTPKMIRKAANEAVMIFRRLAFFAFSDAPRLGRSSSPPSRGRRGPRGPPGPRPAGPSSSNSLGRTGARPGPGTLARPADPAPGTPARPTEARPAAGEPTEADPT